MKKSHEKNTSYILKDFLFCIFSKLLEWCGMNEEEYYAWTQQGFLIKNKKKKNGGGGGFFDG